MTLLEIKLPHDPVCPSSRFDFISRSVGRLVGLSVTIYLKGGKFHLYAPIGVLFFVFLITDYPHLS